MAEEKRKKISETLIAEIGAGKFAGRFPSERALVRRFAAARETVRAALRELEEMRLIRRKVGRGTTVMPTGARRRSFAILLGNGYNINPFYAAMRNGVERALARRGCSLFSVSSLGQKESERMSHAREFTRMCVGERMSGVFMQPLHFLRNGERANRAILSALDEAHIPVVLIDSDFVQPPRRSAYDLVGTDNLRIGYDLAGRTALFAGCAGGLPRAARRNARGDGACSRRRGGFRLFGVEDSAFLAGRRGGRRDG